MVFLDKSRKAIELVKNGGPGAIVGVIVAAVVFFLSLSASPTSSASVPAVRCSYLGVDEIYVTGKRTGIPAVDDAADSEFCRDEVFFSKTPDFLLAGAILFFGSAGALVGLAISWGRRHGNTAQTDGPGPSTDRASP